MISNFITWTFNPDMISWPVTIRWYGMMFAIGFILGVYIISKIFKHEGVKQSWVDSLFVYVILCTVIGARLGHVFFYAWDYYSQNPGEILKVWHGGLASHGGAIGILLGMFLYSWKVTKRNVLWTLDRLVIPVAMVGGLIRMQGAQPIFSVPSHPTQIYEALCYFALFGLLMFLYWKRNAGERQGLITGVFFVILFTARFLIEYIKNPQEDFEVGMILNMGQILSIPFIIAGIILWIRAMKNPRVPIDYKNEFAPEDKK